MAQAVQQGVSADERAAISAATASYNSGAPAAPAASHAPAGTSQGMSGTNIGDPDYNAPPTTQQSPQTSQSAPPSSNLQPGSTGLDVEELQKYLSQMGYLTPQQVGQSDGNYDPTTTAAVAKMQSDLGVQTGGNAGYYGPKTQQALASKYQGIFGTTSGKDAPQTGAAASSYVNSLQQPTDPVFGAMTNSLNPIMGALTQTLNNINNPALTAVSLQQEYNDLAQQNNLPQMQSQLLNYQNIMNGTEDDIRSEISSAGGTATDSQVLGMTSARNKVILKQYNALATNFQAAQTNVQNMMQYAATDQSTQLQRQTATAGIVENMASIQAQIMQMGMTMQQHTTDNLNKVVTNVGYTGLASQAQDNPQMLSYYENSLGLAPGALSNPQSLHQLETLRQQTVAQGAQKVMIQMYNAGLSNGGAPSGPPGTYVTPPGGSSVLVAPQTTGSDSQGRPYSFNGTQAKNLLAGGASTDPGTNNITVPGMGYYIAQQDGSYRLSLDPNSSEGQFVQYSNMAANPAPWQPTGSLSNQRMTRNALTRQANAAMKNYTDSPTYKNVASGATYLAKLDAGLKNPGSVGDPDIIDSLVKINTGGQGAITEQQYQAYAQGQTWSDKFQVTNGKIMATGGTLSPQQRTAIKDLAVDTFSNYQQQYEQLYVQAMKNMQNQQIPSAFWGNLPDWTQMISGASYTALQNE